MVTITKYLRARPANKRFQKTKENKIDVFKSGDFFSLFLVTIKMVQS